VFLHIEPFGAPNGSAGLSDEAQQATERFHLDLYGG
jgi:hypothetical protein